MSCRAFRVGIVAGILLTAYALASAAETPNPAASPSPAVAPSVAPLADKLLTGACQALASSKAFTFHAENYYSDYSAPPAAPALGTTLYSLPPGAYSTEINGSTYYVSGSTYYKPFYSGSQVIYVVSRP